MYRAAPGRMMVDPLPPIVPQAHIPVPFTPRAPDPNSCGAAVDEPNVKSLTSTLVSSVTETGLVITTFSFVLGARLGVQFDPTLQSPPEGLIQVNRKGRKWANRLKLVVIVTVMELLRVSTSPVHA